MNLENKKDMQICWPISTQLKTRLWNKTSPLQVINIIINCIDKFVKSSTKQK